MGDTAETADAAESEMTYIISPFPNTNTAFGQSCDDDDPNCNLDGDAPDYDDKDTVFNAVICQHTIEECSNEMCFNLNYDVILDSENKHLKETQRH